MPQPGRDEAAQGGPDRRFTFKAKQPYREGHPAKAKVTVCLSFSEKAAAERLAMADGETLSNWARKILIRVLTR